MSQPAHERMASFDRARSAAESFGRIRDRGPGQLMAQCPVHGDRNPSLSISWVDGANGGMVLMNCHGCEAATAEIAEALGLQMSDLFDNPLPPQQERIGRSVAQRTAGRRRTKGGRLPAVLKIDGESTSAEEPHHSWVRTRTYPYVSDEGVAVQEVWREECTDCAQRHKQFRQRYVGPDGALVSRKPAGFEPVLYRLPEVHAGLAAGTAVWIFEGEKDADTGAELGLVSTTNAQGSGSFPASAAARFEHATVRVVLDRDGAGYKRGIDLVSLLGGNGAEVQLLLPATGEQKSDFTDHVEAGLWDAADQWGGLVPVRDGEVAAHALTADVLSKESSVEQALEQASARMARIGEDSQHPDHVRARRWAEEAERRFENVRELAQKVQNAAVSEGTDWVGDAVETAMAAVRAARTAARAAHQITGMPIPPALQDERDTSGAEPSAESDTTSDESSPNSGAAGSGSAASIGGSQQHPPVAELSDLRLRGRTVVAPVYRILDGQLVEIVTTKEGDQKAKLVLSIDARIVEMEYLEDSEASGLDVDRPTLLGRDDTVVVSPPSPQELTAVVIGYTHPDSGEYLEIRVPAKEYRDCSWVESLPGPPSYDSRPAGVAKLRDALKSAGGPDIRRVVRFRSTGWRRDENNEWFFVHAGGAITTNGARSAPVLLTGPLRMYDLPNPSQDPQRLRRAFLTDSACMLERIPLRISSALLGHVFRSALGPTPWLLCVAGSPGSFKTSLASIAMQHWGELWDRRRPATSMSGNGDTFNALRIKLNSAKDALFWADDVAPTRDWGAAQKSLEEFARLVHNGESRSRSTRDGLGILDGTPPRASAIVTSEVMPRPGSSGGQRMLVVPIQASDIDLEVLRSLDQPMSRHGRALLMSGFLQWLCPRLDEVRERAFAEAVLYAESMRASGETIRQSDALGSSWAGWFAMTEFLRDVGALTDDEVEQTRDMVALGLTEAGDAATDPDLPMRAGARIRELLVHALSTGVAYVEDVDSGEAPEWPLAARLGWRRTEIGGGFDGGAPRYREDARGIRLGYVVTAPRACDGERQLLCDPAALEQVLKASGQAMTDTLQIDRGTAQRALYDEGILIGEERSGRPPRYTVQRQIRAENRRQRMVALRLERLFKDEPDDPSLGDADEPDPRPLPDPDRGGLFDGWLDGPPSQGSEIASTTHESEQDLTSPAALHQEPSMAIETDAEGNTADAELIDPTACALCGADDAGWSIDGLSMHLPCWWQSTAATRAAARGETIPSPAPENTEPAATTQPAPTRAPKAPAATPTDFTAPAAVLDVDGVWLADGTCVPVPEQFRHVGDAAELVSQLNLGCWTNKDKTWSVPGQIWITDAMLRGVGVDTESLGKRKRNDRLRELTAESSFVTDALADGWQLGGKPGNSLGTWTRVWRGEKKGVWVALISGMSSDGEEMPILADDPTPTELARRLANFAMAVNFPWMISPAATGIDLMIASKPRDWKRVFGPSSSEAVTTSLKPHAPDIDWTRTLTKEESACKYVHAYDRGGSYLAAISGLELPIGEATHFPDGARFDPTVPGYWLIDVPESSDWRFPNPLNPLVNPKSEPQWVTTPTLERATQFGYEPEILEAHLWQEHGRVLLPWYERCRDARTSLDRGGDVDAQRARDQIKVMYTHTLGMLNSKLHLENKVGYSPERHFHITAKATANILYRIEQIGRTSGSWPVAILKDTVLYVSDNPDPAGAWPGSEKQYGRGLGQYKPEGSALLDEHRDFLTGYSYKGKQSLISPGEWEAGDGAEAAS